MRTGLGALAILGVGALLIAPPGAPGPKPVSAQVQLVSMESVLGAPAPLSPVSQDGPWWWLEGDRLLGEPAWRTNPAAASASLDGLLLADRCGLICNGADGAAPGEDGQGGGWLFGNGGSGEAGGSGGAGGLGGPGGAASGATGGTGGTAGPA